MGAKKANSNNNNGGQNGKPTPVPNKEIIQRMNFLHQAATLLSSAVHTSDLATHAPTPDKPTSAIQAQIAAHELEMQSATAQMAAAMESNGQLIPTDMMAARLRGPAVKPQQSELQVRAEQAVAWLHGGVYRGQPFPAEPEPEPEPKPKKRTAASKEAAKLRLAKKREAHYTAYLEGEGLSKEEIQVKLNQRRKRFLRKEAKNTMNPLEVGTSVTAPSVPLTSEVEAPKTVESAKGDGNVYKVESQKSAQGSKTKKVEKARENPKHPSQVEHRNLAVHYVNDIRTMARKNVMRLDPNVKRTMCRNCNALLIPGLTSSVRVLPSKTHVHVLRTKCLACKVSRSIPCPPIPQESTSSSQATGKNVPAQQAMDEMQEDTPTPQSSSSRTLSEPSDPDRAGSTTMESWGDNAASAGTRHQIQAAVDGAMQTVKKRKILKSQKGKSRKQRSRRNADSMVPGTRKQYAKPRFHERSEHRVASVVAKSA